MRNRLLWLALGAAFTLTAQNVNTSKFRQLGQELPTPNVYRTASGAPGHEYYQQQADYNMSITLDDETQRIYGKETITYTNNSPDELRYLWVQLDQNMRAKYYLLSSIKQSMKFMLQEEMANYSRAEVHGYTKTLCNTKSQAFITTLEQDWLLDTINSYLVQYIRLGISRFKPQLCFG